MGNNHLDLYIVGLGGQGVLTIGEIIAEAAFDKNIAVNFYPTKGMSQRGGFVKAQLRLGRAGIGPSIPPKGAGLVISMERSESLKAVQYIKPGADFLLYGHVWAPTAVMLGKAPYPTLEEVWAEVEKAGGKIVYLDPKTLPRHKGKAVQENLYVLGAAMAHTVLKNIFQAEDIITAVNKRWPKGAEENLSAFQAGLKAAVSRSMPDNF